MGDTLHDTVFENLKSRGKSPAMELIGCMNMLDFGDNDYLKVRPSVSLFLDSE